MKRILLISEIRKHREYCGEYACWCINLVPRVLSYPSLRSVRERVGERTWERGWLVHKCSLWLVNGCLEYHRPIITNVCPPKRSRKSLHPQLVPILPRVSEVGNKPFPSSLGLCIKRRLSSQPLIWKCFSFSCKKTNFHKKGCALDLLLKVRVFGTRKWPITKHFITRKSTVSPLPLRLWSRCAQALKVN